MRTPKRAAAIFATVVATAALTLAATPTAHAAATASHTKADAIALDQLPRLHDREAPGSKASIDVHTGLADTATYPLRGEGMIRATSRVCGNANTWQANAARNNVTPPVYLVLLGQALTIGCLPQVSAPAQQSPSPAASSGWANPLPGACITSPYGQWRGSYAHQGVDLAAGQGATIRAAAAGTVVSTAWAGGGGNTTILAHGGGLYTVYMHQSRYGTSPGQHVAAGQAIGYVGQSGDATGPHLHLEIQPSGLWGSRVDPVSYLRARGVRLGC